MKDPALLFYPGDFVTGTQFFTNEQTGKYIRLLCAQFLHGRLSEKHMLIICGTYDEDVFKKFKIDADGLFFNEVLEEHINKRRAYSESRRGNRKGKFKVVNDPDNQQNNIGAEGNNISKTYVNHMVNENVNVNVIKKETAIEKSLKVTTARFEKFKAAVMQFDSEYPAEMLEQFITHWGEMTASKKQMLFETKTTWDLPGRLRTWDRNNAKWAQPPAGKVGPAGKINAAQNRNDDLLDQYQ